MTPPPKLWTTSLISTGQAGDGSKMLYKKNRSLVVKEWDALSGNRDVWLDTGQEVSRQCAIEKGTQKERPRVSAPGWTSLTQNSLSCYCASQYFCSFSGETGGLFIPATCGVKACSRFGWKLAQQHWPTFEQFETKILHHVTCYTFNMAVSTWTFQTVMHSFKCSVRPKGWQYGPYIIKRTSLIID